MDNPEIKNILAPLDLSEASLSALQTAVFLTNKHNARLYILSVDEPEYTFITHGDRLPAISRRNTDSLLKLTEDISNSHDIPIKFITKKGYISESILLTAKSLEADLIIMGTHGESGNSTEFIGTHTDQAIKYSDIPILTIPPKQNNTGFEKALFVLQPAIENQRLDFICQLLSRGSTLEVFALSEYMAPIRPGHLDTIMDKIRDISYKDNIDVNLHINANTTWGTDSTISEDILRFAQLKTTDLIVLTSFSDGITTKGFIDFHIQKIINSSTIASLIIKEK